MVERAHALLFAMLLGVAGCASGPRLVPPSSPNPLVGAALPDFHRPLVGGDGVDTKKERGRVIVLKFFAKYCVPCRRSLPAAEVVHRDFPDALFIGVSEDESEDDALVQIRQFGLSFPVLVDRGNVLAGRFRATELPVVFVVDRKGHVAWVGGPEQGDDQLRQALRAVSD
jgi:peroxiredoxin